MNATKNDETIAQLRERTQRRALENVELSRSGAGARVTDVVRHRLADGSLRVVITNSDRDVSRELVDHAFEALRYSGLVCAPAADGAIALLGLTQPLDDVLAAIQWDTGDALGQLLSAARAQHVSVMLLPPPPSERAAES